MLEFKVSLLVCFLLFVLIVLVVDYNEILKKMFRYNRLLNILFLVSGKNGHNVYGQTMDIYQFLNF